MNKLALQRLAEGQIHVTADTIPGEDEPSKSVSGPLHIAHVPDYDYDHYVVAGHSVHPETVKPKHATPRHVKQSTKAEGQHCLYCNAHDPDIEELCPQTANSKHTLISHSDKEFWGQGAGDGPGKTQDEPDYDPDTLGWDGVKKKKIQNEDHYSSLNVEAHGFDADDTVKHCPMCGSGDVWGGSDGTIECNFCSTHFTVTVEPEFSTMPQTTPDGQSQYGLDGGIQPEGDPSDSGGMLDPSEGDPSDPTQDPQEDEEQPGSPQDEETPVNGSSFQAAKRYYMTETQDLLDEDAFLAHIAGLSHD